MVEDDGSEPKAVVFVSDRSGAGLLRRERCLRLAGIPFEILTERRASGTYFKLCVRERDAVTAYLALQMGGCGKSVRLRESGTDSPLRSIRDMLATLWDEAALLTSWFADLIWQAAPRLIAGPSDRLRTEPLA